ncbi:Endoglucanase-7 [Grifola frondosa]|uniref:lytic cellulose monooxygenase (C4-dehydrogenating) n=1 Tax=Grifola frondosa TaxID=5627 RepID=A0A1C7MWS8_GRIFR|nr:Endoglucanase-7 [Grifola frondosa]
MVVPANPGSSVMFQWYGGGGSKWPHNTGPLMTYMASCGSTTCGKKSDNTTWFQADIMNGDSFTVVLPQSLAPGDYLIRHEIIALQLAVSVGGAEFYPSCTQVRVGGSASGTPQSTVLFPGAYSDTDPGIYDPSVYNPGSDYVFPGPPISNLAAASAGITPPASATPAFPAASGSASTEASASSATSSAVGAMQREAQERERPGDAAPLQPGHASHHALELSDGGLPPLADGISYRRS